MLSERRERTAGDEHREVSVSAVEEEVGKEALLLGKHRVDALFERVDVLQRDGGLSSHAQENALKMTRRLFDGICLKMVQNGRKRELGERETGRLLDTTPG